MTETTPATKVRRPNPWTQLELAGGCVGSLAKDPGSTRWLWSVRWPAHACRTDKCAIPAVPQLFRHGAAASEKAARAAIAAGHSEGPPPAIWRAAVRPRVSERAAA